MTESARFTRTAEDFTCGQCGAQVTGDGYTNHCPVCLWSRHVDINPGDRAAECGALMEPIGIEQRAGVWRVMHECTACGHRKINRVADADDGDVVRALAGKPLSN